MIKPFLLPHNREPWWAVWRKSGENYTCKRIAANFEFPSKQWIDEWMKELPNYIKE